MSESAPLVEYRGNCHCGAFKFTFKSTELKQVFTCDCSICSKNGYLWAFPANADDFAVVKGDENSTLVTYEFGKRTMAHKFCPTCGTSVICRMHNPSNANGMSVGINLRAVADLDFASLPVNTSYKGSALEPAYQVPAPVPAGPVPEGSTEYNGNCHCGAVAYTLLSPEKITELTVTDCNCSICSRDATLWIYPATTNVTFRGLESLTEYTFAKKWTYHGFCKICGVAIYERFVGKRENGEDRALMRALNVRTMNGVDIKSLEVEKLDGKADQPAYEVSV
ncbi:Mss4-like protein [Mycena sp. CBHHK59/15]|nr:Mss4-like protein [Mycena sp. CBHHK59/15]